MEDEGEGEGAVDVEVETRLVDGWVEVKGVI